MIKSVDLYANTTAATSGNKRASICTAGNAVGSSVHSSVSRMLVQRIHIALMSIMLVRIRL